MNINDVLELCINAAADSKVMNFHDIKVRATPYDFFRLADSGKSFLHLTCRLLEGRTSEQKSQLSTLLRQKLTEFLPTVHSISIDIVDMNEATYKKRLLKHSH